MPGVGKTQLALQYAKLHRKDYAAGLWVSAASRETLLSGFAALAEVLNLPERNEGDQKKVVAAVRRWLDTTDQAWLLILDNADELELLQGFLPSGRGHCLLTTRPQDVHALATAERVKSMEPTDGALLLLRRAGHLRPEQSLDAAHVKDRDQATILAGELGGLPLALDQAGAFVAATGVSLAEYLDLYRQRGQTLRAERGQHPLAHPSVTVTFTLAFEQAAQRNPAAVELLRACAFLHPDAIPEELLIEGTPEWGELLATVLVDPLAHAKLFATLNRFSLIVRDPDAKTLTLHRVVQAVLQDELDADDQRFWAERAVRAVHRGFPNPKEFSAWPQCERLLPQAQTAVVWIARWDFAFVEGACLLNQAAGYLHQYGRWAEIEPFVQRALTIWERALGPDHPVVAINLNNLAALYREQGRGAEAEPLYQRALAIEEYTLGHDHPHVAASLNNLAALYHDQGRYAEAESLLQRALAIEEHTLGHDHPAVAQSINNLAALYHAQGRRAKAEPLFQRALAIRERILDPDHPDVATSLNNLARLYHDQSRHAEAEPLLQRALDIWERTLGPDHSNIARSLNNLAALYHDQGRYAEAEPLVLRALTLLECTLGPDHPHVATSLNSLARLYHDQNRYAEAEPLVLRALDIWERALGPDHPRVATILNNYAILLEKTDRPAEATTLRRRAQTIRERHAQANLST